MKIKSQRDFWSGLMFLVVGIGFAIGASDYSLGTSARPGPGYFPLILSVIMAILGGRFFISPDIIDIHGYIGNFVFLLVIGFAGLLYLSKPGGPLGKVLLGLSLLTVLLVIGLVGAGIVGAALWAEETER